MLDNLLLPLALLAALPVDRTRSNVRSNTLAVWRR